MFILKKMFQLRDKANPDAEKPFFDHLEDLRVLITKIVVTLLIATLICFMYKDQLMEVIQRPVNEVWIEKNEERLPKDESISLDDWERALALSQITPALEQQSPELAATFWASEENASISTLTKAALIYRAVKELPEDEQTPFIESIPDADKEVRELAAKLLISEPAANLNSQGNLRIMSSLKPTETFMLTMKLAFFAGIVISFPFLLYFLLQFVLPGLKKEERRALWPALAIGFGLFLGGVFFSYFFVLPKVLTFFYDWGQSMGISNDWRIGYYISFATTFVLIFGLAFELPVVVMTLVHLGILSFTVMNSTRAYAVLAIVVIAAIITPTPDIPTLLLLAGPMYILYEICIWLSYFYERKRKKEEEAEEKDYLKRLLADPTDPTDEPDSEEESEEEGEVDESHEDEDHDDYLDYPGEHQNPEEDPDHDPDYDPLGPPDEDIPSEEQDRK
ncbi:twin-arginine translocase subunit TatC [Akkermansiaceae bacterium]|nr:twin-arginine translocase subunit TatC [Akkermansiaceae bacterium]MDB0056834.1 twin-arginine translocase subunit TatC [Akkermansiaceae bacterium]MDB4382118.1 twin-arginine translocase subunit TatC [Akkermansiaceae bacterium]MDB4554566.1 twin-arginine translocase subunit TatC [Akkermansiaceae bacterium]MDB4693047.1 twin-arginine translocase subunit TatC [Akkermansiaceae bacterium]